MNAVSLSVSISIGGPCMRKTFSNCRITVDASCQCSGRNIANLEGPQSMIVRKFSPLWWVMSIVNLLQLSFTLSFPFFQRTGAGSINRQVSQPFTTEQFLWTLVGQPTWRNIKSASHLNVHFDDECQPLGPCPVVFPPLRNSQAPALFLPWANPSTCAALWWDYLRNSDKTMVSPYSFASDHKVPNRHLTSQLPSCLHVLFQLKCRKSTGACMPNQWPSVILSPPTEGPN